MGEMKIFGIIWGLGAGVGEVKIKEKVWRGMSLIQMRVKKETHQYQKANIERVTDYWLIMMMKLWNGSACEKRAREFKGIQTFPQFVDCLLFVVVLWCKSPHMKLFWGVHLQDGVCLIVLLNLMIMQGSKGFMFCKLSNEVFMLT